MSRKDERGYIILHAGKRIRFRNLARVLNGEAESFIQVELVDESKLDKPLIIFRCDKRKNIGYHIDMYDINQNKVVSHKKISSQTPEKAIHEVMEDLKLNLACYLNKLAFTSYVNDLPPDWKEKLNAAEAYLLDTLKEPSEIIGKKTRSSLGITADAVLIDVVTPKVVKGDEKKQQKEA